MNATGLSANNTSDQTGGAPVFSRNRNKIRTAKKSASMEGNLRRNGMNADPPGVGGEI